MDTNAHALFMAEAWGRVAIGFIYAGNIGAAAFAARRAAVHAFHVLGWGE
jgi:hypothetical protein